MRILRHGWRTGPDRLLLIVLLLMLCLSGILAYQAWDAARSQRQVTEAALRDYARFAAWELRRRVESDASLLLNSALMPALFRAVGPAELSAPPMITRRGPGEATGPGMIARIRTDAAASPDLAIFALGVDNALRACVCAGAASDYFMVDHDAQGVQVHNAMLGPAFRDWLTAGFIERARSAAATGPQAGLLTPQPANARRITVPAAGAGSVLMVEEPIPYDSSHVVVYAAVQRGEARHFYGFALDGAAFARAMIEQALSGPSLLPPSLTGPARNDDVLSVAVWSARGDTIFRTAGTVATNAAVLDTLRLASGALTAGIAVRPELASRLVIGGLPRSRLPILIGSVGLTLALLLIALFQLRRQQELFRLRSDFVSGVTHELRTPLAQIRLFSELLATERLDEGERRRSFRILTDEARRLTYLVGSVLRFSESNRRSSRIAAAPVNVGRYLREIVDDFAPLASSGGAQLVLNLPDAFGDEYTDSGLYWVLDPDAMRQVMLNLLDNAVKYGPRGQTIRVNAFEDSGSLRIEVEDEGPGIPASERERIWEPYRRLAREAETATGGSGIGLAVARELVSQHGGRTFVTDAVGGGSSFVVLLPPIEQDTGERVDPVNPSPGRPQHRGHGEAAGASAPGRTEV